MNITALRSINKIKSNVLQNSGRLFSFKFEMTAAKRLASDQQQEEAQPVPEEAVQQNATPAVRYTVCQSRTSPVEKASMGTDVAVMHKHNVKAAIEEQHLQPAMLPEYYQKQMEKSALVNPEPDASEEERINKGIRTDNQRRFQMSKTHTNAIFPLKSVKLANPFPEPVKMMISRTVSDDEKAEQMLADARSQRQMSDLSNKNYRTFSTAVKRWFSSSSKESSSGTVGVDPEKCKKAKGRKGCPKIILKECPPVSKNTSCQRAPKDIKCKKQEAPYPAYSEFCHEDIIEKPSECKLCPWRPEDNPNFKPSNKKFHTTSKSAVRRSGLELEYQEEVGEIEAAEENPEEMKCDLRKPQCERPKNTRCPAPKKEKKEEKKKEKPKKDCMSTVLERTILGEMVQPAMSLKTTKGEKPKGHGNCKIKKFKFPRCQKVKRQVVDDGKCPTKKKHIQIQDCPPEDDKGCTTLGIMEYKIELASDNDKVNKDKKKCPHIDMTVLKEEDTDDPCGLKRKGTTKVCPADLLKKKRRNPRKKTSSKIITPVESQTEIPQPTRTI